MARLLVALLLAASVVSAWALPAQAAKSGDEPTFVADQVLVQYRDGTPEDEQKDARKSVNGQSKEKLGDDKHGSRGLEVVELPANSDVKTAIDKLKKHASVEYAEPNWIVTRGPRINAQPSATSPGTSAMSCPACNDEYFERGWMWGMFTGVDSAGVTHTNTYGSQAGQVWAAGKTGSKSVIVGVIDEGIDISHPDLSANIWTNAYDPLDGVDNDDNGYIDDIHGWDFVGKDNSVFDAGQDAHGTHVAGTIGARGGNDLGVAGVNWDVTIISGKFLAPGGGTIADAVKAVNYFTDLKTRQKLNIVALNNSWGGGGYSQAMHEAIIRAAKANILFIAAAGNDGRNNDLFVSYPSGYSTLQRTSRESAASYDSVVAVAAIDEFGKLASWSNYGRKTVDLGAPGVGIGSTVPGGSYEFWAGTSMATPHVTGAAALYASTHPTATGAQIRSALLNGKTSTSSLSRKTATGGRLNISTSMSK